MAAITFHTDVLRSFLQEQKIASLPQLKQALGTTATMTVFRRLKELGYQTSYSHRGKYYTLAEIPKFDSWGLWCCRSVWFSRHGNLLQTCRHFIEQAEAGLTAGELESLLHVEVKHPLLQLYHRKQVTRKEMDGLYVYLAYEAGQRKKQILCRLERPAVWEIGISAFREGLSQELNAAFILFFSLLDEKQRRLYAGLESFKLGHGGDRQIAAFLGLDVHTVARGRRELFGGEVQREGARRKGAGRPAVEKKRPRSSSRSPN
jgi:hypothetical protein